ncbi:hypothetical protein Dimus_039393 [Dionaea muscipula]
MLLFSMIGVWNVRGLNRSDKHIAIKRLIATYRLNLLGILETRVRGANANGVLSSCCRGWGFLHNYSEAVNGRIWCVSNVNKVRVSLLSCSDQVLHCHVVSSDGNFDAVVSFVYAHNTAFQRKRLWSDLIDFGQACTCPWIVLGDFNAFLKADEKVGHNGIEINPCADFWNCVMTVGIKDLPASGCLHTWFNNQGSSTWMRIKLDRALGNQIWFDRYARADAKFLESSISDHSPVIISVGSLEGRILCPFKFLNCWALHPRFLPIVAQEWSVHVGGVKMYRVVQKLKALKYPLRSLHKCFFSDIEGRVLQAMEVLTQAQVALRAEFTEEHRMAEMEARERLQHLMAAENSFLKQKLKDDWFHCMDRSTKYFYSLVKGRRIRSQILCITREDGSQCTEKADICNEIVDYYRNLLGTKMLAGGESNWAAVESGPLLSDDQALSVAAGFSAGDVTSALNDLQDDKAPGVDGYTPLFFKKCWPIIGKDVTDAVLDFFTTGKMLKSINTTVVHLIAKVSGASYVRDYRPISCCSTIYKIISRMLCRRLVKVLPDIIHLNQSAFVSNRLIMDNIMLCQGLLHGYDRQGISPRSLAKVDLQKAYDSVDWQFLEKLLLRMRFPTRFVEWVMVCVSSVSYTFSVNGELHGWIKGARGIRQGDPLSLYLFVVVMKYFSRSLMQMSKSQAFGFHPKCKRLGIVNLSFADDLMIFARADSQS